MKQVINKAGIAVLSVIMVIFCSINTYAFTTKDVETALLKHTEYMYKKVPKPQMGSMGGEWLIFALARSEAKVPKDYYEAYYKRIEAYVKNCKGKLHERKYTEYSRVIIALTAIGKDPQNVGGYNLLTPLGDYDKTTWQGLNSTIWALVALDAGDYKTPLNKEAKTQATRQMYINKILGSQLADGGFSLTAKGKAEPDITAMALVALSRYQDQKAVKTAVDKAIQCLSQLQQKDGSYVSYGVKNAESIAQVIVALTELGIKIDDSRFVKGGHTLLEQLMSFEVKEGGFKHILSEKTANQMATEQCVYALAAIQRSQQNKSSLYHIKQNMALDKKEVKNEKQ